MAMHISGSEHERSVSKFVSDGGVWGFHEMPSLVFMIPVPPTAVHSMVVTQEIDCGGKDGSWIVHVEPPSIDFMIPDPPPA
jgi:hypothetical protein